MTGTLCNGWYEDNWLPLIQGDRLYRTRAREVILATGAIGQPAIFRNNDLPGIMLGSAAQRLIRHYGVRPGQKAVVLTGSDEGYAVALDLVEAGVSVMLVADPRSGGLPGPLEAELHGKGVAIQKAVTVEAAEGSERTPCPRSRGRALGRMRPADDFGRRSAGVATALPGRRQGWVR